MFEVGKKYRYTGKGNTRFNSDGMMDYMKKGEHEVEDVMDGGMFSINKIVTFADDPNDRGWYLDADDFEEVEVGFKVGSYYAYNGGDHSTWTPKMKYLKTGAHKVETVHVWSDDDGDYLVRLGNGELWWLNPQDFDEVEYKEDKVFSIYKWMEGRRTEEEVREYLRDFQWPLECEGKTVREIAPRWSINDGWLVPRSEYRPFKLEEEKVFSIYKYLEDMMYKESALDTFTWALKADGYAPSETRFHIADDWCVPLSEFRPYKKKEKKTKFIGFEAQGDRHAILTVPREDKEDECMEGYTIGIMGFKESTRDDFPNWYWGGDVFESLEDAIEAIPTKGSEPVYFDSMKALMTWIVEAM